MRSADGSVDMDGGVGRGAVRGTGRSGPLAAGRPQGGPGLPNILHQVLPKDTSCISSAPVILHETIQAAICKLLAGSSLMVPLYTLSTETLISLSTSTIYSSCLQAIDSKACTGRRRRGVISAKTYKGINDE